MKNKPDLSIHPDQRGVVTFAEYTGYYKHGKKKETYFGVQIQNLLFYIDNNNEVHQKMINYGGITKTFSEPPEDCDKRLIDKYHEAKKHFNSKSYQSTPARFIEVEISENEFKMLNAYRKLNREQKLEVTEKIKSFLN